MHTRKFDQDIIDEKPFAWLELPNGFSTGSSKRTRTDDSKSEADYASFLTSKKVDFLIPDQKDACELSKFPVSKSTYAQIDWIAIVASPVPDLKSMKGVEGHKKLSVLE